MKQPIRLTNKTAMALRRSAKKVRTAYFAATVIVSILLGAAGVVLGFMWLPAVPLMIAAIALIDCALMIASRSRYLSLIGQAICTEAAAREIRSLGREQKRKERAISDLMDMKADIKKAQPRKMGDTQPFFEKDMEKGAGKPHSCEAMGHTMVMPAAKIKAAREQEEDAPRRRRADKSLQQIR